MSGWFQRARNLYFLTFGAVGVHFLLQELLEVFGIWLYVPKFAILSTWDWTIELTAAFIAALIGQLWNSIRRPYSPNVKTVFKQIGIEIAYHPRPAIAALLCLLGVLFLAYLTPLFGSFFAPPPSISSVSNRLVFAVAWLPVNNFPQTTQVNFNTVNDQLIILFSPNGVNDQSHQNVTGILYITEPFAITDTPFPAFGNWTYGNGTQIFGPGGWHIMLDYRYDSSHLPCGNNGLNCLITFDTAAMTRTDLNGAVSMEIQYKASKGSVNICGRPECDMTSRNMTASVLVAVPHDTSSLQASPMTTGTDFNQAYTNLEWDNLTSAVVLNYISPQKLAQYQFFILTSGILIFTGVAVGVDSIAKWVEAKNRLRRILANQLTD